MTLPAGQDAIDDDELLFRRVPVKPGWVSPHGVSPQAFRPREDDTTGLSLLRAKFYATEADVPLGRSTDGYYLALLRAGDLRRRGIPVQPAPLPDLPGHAEIPGLTYAERKSARSREWMDRLADLTLRVSGPLGGISPAG